MSIEPRAKNGNILIRHLHRHNQISTLFRSVETGAAGRLSRPASSDVSPAYPAGQVVSARLVFLRPELPWGDVSPVEVNESETPSHLVEGSRPAPATSGLSQPAAGQELTSQEETRQAYEQTASETEDLAWRRLDNIQRSQQEQVQQEAAAEAARSSAGGEASILQRQPEYLTQPARPATTRPAAPVTTSLPPVEHRSDSRITDADWRRLEAISRAHEEKEQRQRAALSQKIQKTSETSAPKQTTPAVPATPPAHAATRPVQDQLETEGKAEVKTGKPPVPKVEELPVVEEQPPQAQVSSPPARMQDQPSRVQRAWQQLQNVFGKHAVDEPHEPGGALKPAATPSMETGGGEKPLPADVQLKPIAGQDRSSAALKSQPGKPVEEGPLPQSPSTLRGPVSPVENVVPETAAEGQSLARPASENTIENRADARVVKFDSESGQPEPSPASAGPAAVIQPKETGSRELAPEAKDVENTKPTHQPASVLPVEPIFQQEKELVEQGFETDVIEKSGDELKTQPLPLEEVWPVERLEPKAPVFVQKVETSPTLIQAQPAEVPVEETTQVQRLLQDVQPGQPTDSKLEVVTPRRPRPQVPPGDQGGNQGLTSGEVQAAQETPVIQRSPESELSSPETLSLDQAPAGLNPELAQLWGMLDELESDQSRPALPVSPESVSVSKAGPAIQRAEQLGQRAEQPVYDENYLAARSPETSELISPPDTSLVQRQETAPASASQAAPETGEAASKPGKPDIDELARQVYAEIRRKLALEWERMRR